MNDRPNGAFYEDLEVGAAYTTKGRTVTEADIVNFAGVTGDYNEIHMNEELAKTTPFGKRIAHGLLGLSMSMGLVQQLNLYQETVIAFLGLTWNFKGPILIGDTIHVVQSIKSKRETKNPERGIVVWEGKIVNQRGEVVQEGERTLMVRRRPKEA
jgi:acyl dehydratase